MSSQRLKKTKDSNSYLNKRKKSLCLNNNSSKLQLATSIHKTFRRFSKDLQTISSNNHNSQSLKMHQGQHKVWVTNKDQCNKIQFQIQMHEHQLPHRSIKFLHISLNQEKVNQAHLCLRVNSLSLKLVANYNPNQALVLHQSNLFEQHLQRDNSNHLKINHNKFLKIQWELKALNNFQSEWASVVPIYSDHPQI